MTLCTALWRSLKHWHSYRSFNRSTHACAFALPFLLFPSRPCASTALRALPPKDQSINRHRYIFPAHRHNSLIPNQFRHDAVLKLIHIEASSELRYHVSFVACSLGKSKLQHIQNVQAYLHTLPILRTSANGVTWLFLVRLVEVEETDSEFD